MSTTSEKNSSPQTRLCEAFFSPSQLRNTLTVLYESNTKAHDPIAHTVSTMLTTPVHVQLTATGWQPFRGKELTFPFHKMSEEQRTVWRELLESDETWNVYEHAMNLQDRQDPQHLAAIDVLEAMCSTILESESYPDKRLRVVICNILLQRVQASIPIDKSTQALLNERLFLQSSVRAT